MEKPLIKSSKNWKRMAGKQGKKLGVFRRAYQIHFANAQAKGDSCYNTIVSTNSTNGIVTIAEKLSNMWLIAACLKNPS